MTKPTINERVEKMLDNEENIYFFGPDAIPTINSDFLRDFARLICEEMTGKYRKFHTPEIHTQVCGGHSCACIGYDCRVAQEMDKAQEILKALE